MLAKVDSSEVYQVEADRYQALVDLQDTDDGKRNKQFQADCLYTAAMRHEPQYLGPITVLVGNRSVTLHRRITPPCYAFITEGEFPACPDYYFEAKLTVDLTLKLQLSYNGVTWFSSVVSRSRTEVYRVGYDAEGASPQVAVDILAGTVLKDVDPFHSVFSR